MRRDSEEKAVWLPLLVEFVLLPLLIVRCLQFFRRVSCDRISVHLFVETEKLTRTHDSGWIKAMETMNVVVGLRLR